MSEELPHRKTCKRYDIPGHAHYLTFSCWQRRAFLSRDRTCNWFIDCLARAKAVHPFELWSFVLMPEHVHLIIFPHEQESISHILKSIKDPVAKKAVFWVKRNRPESLDVMADREGDKVAYHFWLPGGGYDRNIWTNQELHEKIRYVHANPVRRGLVENPRDWPWSSYRAWEDGVDSPIAIDRDTLPPLGL